MTSPARRRTKAVTAPAEHIELFLRGVLTIETRPIPTSYRGPIVLHTSGRDPQGPAARRDLLSRRAHAALPDGCELITDAVVGSAILDDCLPIVDIDDDHDGTSVVVDGERAWIDHAGELRLTYITAQLAYGDFRPGRWALLLEDIRPAIERCPVCWRTPHCSACDDQRTVPVLGGGGACPDCYAATPPDCRVCDDYGWSDPVPTRYPQAGSSDSRPGDDLDWVPSQWRDSTARGSGLSPSEPTGTQSYDTARPTTPPRPTTGGGPAMKRPVTTDPDDRAWQDCANCLGVDPDLFFPERGASTREAKEVCRGCIVRAQCLEYALVNAEKFGIWGGMSERERRRIRRQRALARQSTS